jgi:hypothetical protein
VNHHDTQDEDTRDEDAQDGRGREDWFLRAAARVGDLTSPFYREERQRDVWNEASAVGLQLTLWLGLAAATAMVWIGGEESLPYAVTVVGLVGAVSWVVVGYAHRLGVQVEVPARSVAARLLPCLLLFAAFGAGVVRAAPREGFSGSFARGAAVGATAAVVALLVLAQRAHRRRTAS